MCNNILVRDATYFTRPVDPWQRRYEALRASFVERLPAQLVAERYGFSPGYIRLLRHQFSHGKIDFSEPSPEGRIARRRVGAPARRTVGGRGTAEGGCRGRGFPLAPLRATPGLGGGDPPPRPAADPSHLRRKLPALLP